MTDYIILERIGYGSNFNRISIDKTCSVIKKECINQYGKKKIEYEKGFYRFLIDNKINFKTPKIYSFQENGYTMEYCKNYEPLYTVFNKLNKNVQESLIHRIKDNINLLHSFHKKEVSKEEYYHHLSIEINDKLFNRFDAMHEIIERFKFIKTVNGIKVMSFKDIVNTLNTCIYKLLQDKPENAFYFVPLHGDSQFNNILYNSTLDDFVFIDPRGYYGNSEIYGVPEYDFAKLLFALSGYDEFDNRVINSLEIANDDIKINISFLDDDILNIHSLSALLMYTIWLGNAECFIHKNQEKGVYSYFISLYLGTLFSKDI
jgi:hypothetical protein